MSFKGQGVRHNWGRETVALDAERTRHRVDETRDSMVLGVMKQHGRATRENPLAVRADFSKRISGMVNF